MKQSEEQHRAMVWMFKDRDIYCVGTGKKYHTGGCSASIEHMQFYEAFGKQFGCKIYKGIEAAEADGFTPCGTCFRDWRQDEE